MATLPVARSSHRFALAVVAGLALSGVAAGEDAALGVPDTMAQRMQACVTCHGKEGRATREGWSPRIAGKPAGYLYNQLINFREGRRYNAAMTYLVEHLSDAYLREMAEYFAGLDLPYPSPQSPAASKDILARGERLALEGDRARGIPACVQCHGRRLTGTLPAIPGLLGLPRDYIAGQFAFWANGQRKAAAPDCMAHITGRFTVDDIRAVSTWLAAQPVPADSKPAARIELPLPLECGSGLS
jgi:cytochrome c553